MSVAHTVGGTLVGGLAAVAVASGLFRGAGELESANAEQARLLRVHHDTDERHRFNRTVVREVADGRLPLADGAALLWQSNRDERGYVTCLERSFAAPTAEARAARNLIFRVAVELRDDPPRRGPTIARLEAEYARVYGPSPTHPGTLDGDL